MSYTTKHKRMKPVLDLVRKLDIATNPAPEALFEAGSGGFQIWAAPDDHTEGWDDVPIDMGAFAKPCAFVASVWWGWEGDQELAPAISHLCLEAEAYDLRTVKQRPLKIHNRP